MILYARGAASVMSERGKNEVRVNCVCDRVTHRRNCCDPCHRVVTPCWMSYTLTQLAIYIRVLIALFTRTFFQPDEYFQSLEPAHILVFGYGHLTWEWMISQPIRSIIYPALNVPIYYFLKVTGLSELGQLGDLLLVGDS